MGKVRKEGGRAKFEVEKIRNCGEELEERKK